MAILARPPGCGWDHKDTPKTLFEYILGLDAMTPRKGRKDMPTRKTTKALILIMVVLSISSLAYSMGGVFSKKHKIQIIIDKPAPSGNLFRCRFKGWYIHLSISSNQANSTSTLGEFSTKYRLNDDKTSNKTFEFNHRKDGDNWERHHVKLVGQGSMNHTLYSQQTGRVPAVIRLDKNCNVTLFY